VPLPCTGALLLEDILKTVASFVSVSGDVRNLFVDYEGDFVPIINHDQLHIVCQLVAVYHNACVKARLRVSL